MKQRSSGRARINVLTALAGIAWVSTGIADDTPAFRLATFSADVTPPLGHPLLGGATIAPPASRIDDPLLARGFVLIGGDRPIVVIAVDWCEIRNDAYDQWRSTLAQVADTDPSRVLVTSVHQHDAPLADLEAQRILDAASFDARIIDPAFHERTVAAVADALRNAMTQTRRVTHLGLGQARVRDLSSNRRFLNADGTPRFDRGSMSGGNEAQREAPDELIDPWLKTLSFWDGDVPVCALSSYAVHPMSYWGTGWVTSDFPGLARELRQADDESIFQIYASGASGNVTAGKYNDGSRDNRPVLVRKLYEGMVEAWQDTKRQPLTKVEFCSAPLRLELREHKGFTRTDLTETLSSGNPMHQARAALGLSWRKRVDAGIPLEIPAVDFGPAQLILLPAESYLEFQLLAQQVRPDQFVMVMGYGDCAPGYIPTQRAWAEDDTNLTDWCWVNPGAEQVISTAIRAALDAPTGSEADRSE